MLVKVGTLAEYRIVILAQNLIVSIKSKTIFFFAHQLNISFCLGVRIVIKMLTYFDVI